MKKFLIYFFAFVFICFILPALLTKRDIINVSAVESSNTDITKEETPNENVEKYDYSNYSTIRLLHKKTGEIENVDLDSYLVNVVSSEMPASYELEALKAQAIVARTYTIYQIRNNSSKHENSDICDDSTCCQAWISKEDRLSRWDENLRDSYWQKIEQCVNETKGIIITYNNEPINAFFHSNSGGTTELPVNVWGGGSNLEYLQVVETAGEEGYSQYSSEVELTQEQLLEKLKEKYSDIEINFENADEIKILENTDSGRVKTIKFGNHELSGVETRTIFGLKSTNFEVTIQDNKIKFSVKGYGHGVGMSQTGANTMAKEGSTYEDIIKHFYVGVEVVNF